MQKKSGPTDIQRRTETRQLEELTKLRAIEAQKTAAAGRRTRGRASLISGSERGITSEDEQKNFMASNVETSTRLGVQRREAAQKQSLIDTAERSRVGSERDKAAKKVRNREALHDIVDPARRTAKKLGLMGLF